MSVQLVKVNCSYAPASVDHCHALCSLSYHTLILFAEVEVLSLVYLLEALKAFLFCWVAGSDLVFFKVLNCSILHVHMFADNWSTHLRHTLPNLSLPISLA